MRLQCGKIWAHVLEKQSVNAFYRTSEIFGHSNNNGNKSNYKRGLVQKKISENSSRDFFTH